MQKEFSVLGMFCAACSSSIERVLSKKAGINKAEVNLLAKKLICDYDETKISEQDIINIVNDLGFNARSNQSVVASVEVVDHKKRNLIISFLLMLVIMYMNMGQMLGLPVFAFIREAKYGSIFGLTQLLITIVVMYLNRHYYKKGYKALIKNVSNMDTLIAVSSTASFTYGLVALYYMMYANSINDLVMLNKYRNDLYFEACVMILVFVSFGKYLEERQKSKTNESLESLVNLTPKTAHILDEDGDEKEVFVENINVGDIMIVKPGESFAVDGVIVSGETEVDNQAITGESNLISLKVGDEIISAGINKTGLVKVKATKVKEDATINKIIKLVESAQATKANISRQADRISGVFVPVVLGISLVTFIIWLLMTKDFSTAFNYGVTVLVISCPCALGLATPVAITVSTGKMAQKGILIKKASTIEEIARIKYLLLDKTNTLTTGEFKIIDYTNEDILRIASCLEKGSNHPIAKALNYQSDLVATDIKTVPGKGITGIIDGKRYYIGNSRYMQSLGCEVKKSNYTSVYVYSDKLLGYIYLTDTIKDNAKDVINKIKSLNIEPIMISGDNEFATKTVAKSLDIQFYEHNVLPDQKAIITSKYMQKGATMFVGDGINDSIAITKANVGVSLDDATDAAIDSSDVVLMSDDLYTLSNMLVYARKTMRNIKQNLFWALCYNAIGIPLAAGVFSSFGLRLTPMIASIMMAFSSVLVVTNALRLRKIIS